MLAAISSIEAEASSAEPRPARSRPGDSCSALADSSWLPAETFSAAVERVGHHAAQPLDHPLQRQAQRVLVGQGLGLDRQIAVGDLVGERGGGAQIAVMMLTVSTRSLISSLVVTSTLWSRSPMATASARPPIRLRPLLMLSAIHSRGADGDQQRHEAEADQQCCAALEVGVGLVDVGLELRVAAAGDQSAITLVGDRRSRSGAPSPSDRATASWVVGPTPAGCAIAVVDAAETAQLSAQRLPLGLARRSRPWRSPWCSSVLQQPRGPGRCSASYLRCSSAFGVRSMFFSARTTSRKSMLARWASCRRATEPVTMISHLGVGVAEADECRSRRRPGDRAMTRPKARPSLSLMVKRILRFLRRSAGSGVGQARRAAVG